MHGIAFKKILIVAEYLTVLTGLEQAVFKDKDGIIQNTWKVPSSCCADVAEKEDFDRCVTSSNPLPENSFFTGCWTKFQDDVIEANKDYILYSGIAIIVIMFLNMLSAFAMCTMAKGD